MFDINQLNNEINTLKMETLSKYGKKVDITMEFIKKEEHLLDRYKKIQLKIPGKIETSNRKKRNILKSVNENLGRKIKLSENRLQKLVSLREKYIEEYKFQRESLGIIEHTFIDEFYQNK